MSEFNLKIEDLYEGHKYTEKTRIHTYIIKDDKLYKDIGTNGALSTKWSHVQYGLARFKEAEPELTSYDEWVKDNEHYLVIPTNCKDCSVVKVKTAKFFTRKELLRRYIEHLASIVNEGWKPNWRDAEAIWSIYHSAPTGLHVESWCHISYSNTVFKSDEAAQRVISVAEKEIKELYNVKE